MEDEVEVLDWGNEDDEQQLQLRAGGDIPEEAEDAVSLGGDEDDMQAFYAYQPRADQELSKPPLANPRSAPVSQQLSQPQPSQPHQQNTRELNRENSSSSTSQNQQSSQHSSSQSPLKRSHSFGKMTHALPPKPVAASAPTIPAAKEISTLASSMISRAERERRINGKSHSSPVEDPLPPDWEARQPRSGSRETYYYNVKTHQSTWTRPTVNGAKPSPPQERDQDKERGRSQTRDLRPSGKGSSVASSPTKSSDQAVSSRPVRSETTNQLSAVALGDNLSYEDRHYRPADLSTASNGKREDRLGNSTSRRSLSRSRSPSPKDNRYDRSESRTRQDRNGRPRRDSSPTTSDRITRRERDVARMALSDADRTWIAPEVTPLNPLRRDDRPTRERSLEPPTRSDNDRIPRRDADWPSPISTLSPSSHPPTHRMWRLRSCRGGGRVSHDCLEKPRESSRAVFSYFSRLSSGLATRTLIIAPSVLSSSINFYPSSLLPSSSHYFVRLLSRAQISATPYS
ncbi:hypothetical protein JAAARDRAFT_56012 [Jaapia argillacea MUCL 33604]|uniref:WW domain-containing protein n=1 Tax=Jaapia argillacea MUCL 33604 TaxID=933084 RepID=A0A067PYW0_9AGAM|nr:hypothetical protein JAAARDRAFT_56012 [Jaapia argillacea MUCL 33604]